MTTATATSLRDSLAAIVGPDRVLDRPVDLIAFASDASFYRLIPKAVAFAGSVDDVRGLFRLSHERKIPMTFRAAGTSLSGQSVSDGILVEVARNWRGIQVLECGAKVKVQPGVIGAHVNHALKFFKAKMGPDPASINTCTVGGILSNNSSGMCCGVTQNAYHTLESLTFVLPSGIVIGPSGNFNPLATSTSSDMAPPRGLAGHGPPARDAASMTGVPASTTGVPASTCASGSGGGR